jgi:hypothetical protein
MNPIIGILDQNCKVARQDLDYGGRPEAIPGLESELAAARVGGVA